MEFAGQRPWPKFGLLAEGTAVHVYRRRGAERSLNLRRNNYREFLGRKPPLIVQDVIDVLFAIAIVSAAMLTVMLWFLVSTVSGPLGPSPRTLDAIAFRIVSPLLISWTELGPSMVFFVQLAWWAALKLALCNVLAYGGYRVLGYVLPFLRFAPYR